MPKFIVVEKRALKNAVLIEADDESQARGYVGDILDELETDTWGDELLSIEEVSDDTEDLSDFNL